MILICLESLFSPLFSHFGGSYTAWWPAIIFDKCFEKYCWKIILYKYFYSVFVAAPLNQLVFSIVTHCVKGGWPVDCLLCAPTPRLRWVAAKWPILVCKWHTKRDMSHRKVSHRQIIHHLQIRRGLHTEAEHKVTFESEESRNFLNSCNVTNRQIDQGGAS